MKKATFWGSIFVGILFAMGGVWVSREFHTTWESFAEKGIPLDLGETLAAIGVLLILFKVLEIFFIVPLRDAIQSRTNELENTFGEADTLRQQMTTMRNEYEQRLAATEAAAREQIQAQIREAQDMRQQLMSEASAKADEFLRKAQEEISTEKEKALTELRLNVVNLSLMATERILGENVDQEKNKKLVEDFLTSVEVPA